MRIAAVLEEQGYTVWWDEDLPAHRPYSEVIEERLRSSRAVLVIWSAGAVRSEWVRAEADAARLMHKLVQLSIDGVLPPMPFNQIQCPALDGWAGDREDRKWRKIEASIAELVRGTGPVAPHQRPSEVSPAKQSVCVLPFVNMSGDLDQEYFSDGITEDLITDLSKVSALGVIARNTSFTFKGRAIEARSLGRELRVTHIVEGSVRKSGGRLRITAQLIDASIGHHLWAERYDRELADIFDIQDEISHAIVDALKIKLLPAERTAIEQRGTENADAYNLYLMARQHWAVGNDGDWDREELIIRICERAIDIDPSYANAWALMAIAQTQIRFRKGRKDVDGLPSAERALELNPHLAEAHAVRAWSLLEQERADEANEEVATALRLDPESWEVNRVAGKVLFLQGRLREAATCYAKASELMEADYSASGMLECCYRGLGDLEGSRRAAQMTLRRVEKALVNNPRDAAAMANGAGSLAVLGDHRKAREWAESALSLDPHNYILRANIACAFARELNDHERAMDLVEDTLIHLGQDHVRHVAHDPDFKALHQYPRFIKILDDARRRLAASK
ncbi:TIR domain-containing protein [Sphingomonas sp. SE220]|uniref:TIR domain-containing protein n=2 Tax=Sphingomonas hankyongi TaxID=2908209 RepID=A0ABT0RZG3_9SPHN|nr:TIR domain-containing protein [Sphingomonas hankyongi]